MPFERQEPITVWTIAGGTALGIIAAHIIEAVAAIAIANISIEYAKFKAESMIKEQQRIAAQENERRRQQIEEDRQIKAEEMRQAAAAQKAQIEAERKKEKAWEGFFKKSPICDSPPNNVIFTQCANDYIKAHRAFDEQYRP